MSLNEATTRMELIDPALLEAGWDVTKPNQVGIEIPVDGFDADAWQRQREKIDTLRESGLVWDGELPSGISDYVLYRENGEIIAIVEAKRTSVDPRLAEAQTEFYVSELEKLQSFRPFAFMTNGLETYYWDVGRSNKRQVQGFFSPSDLENRLSLRENRQPLTSIQVNSDITDRGYQQEAIQRVCETFEQGKRQALIVMATGTGKTRVAMSLVDIFLRSNQARRILFVADRDALVKQAQIEGFQEFIPSEPLTRLTSSNIDKTKRLYVVTLQTLNNIYRKFTPGFFDLIIFDEVHRSIFNKWNEALKYFDARLVGLTATPADFIERNTFLEFGCPDEKPTALYTYQEAIDEEYLVDFRPYTAQTKFQRKGIRGAELSEEDRNTLIEQGLDPDELDYSGTDLEKIVSNRDTIRKQWQEIWDICYRDKSGQLPGKTIIFASSQQHALRLADVFEEMYPQFPGLVKVITHKSEYKGRLVREFKKEDMPRIAISVDMLETGVNVPEVVNLVFMRPVHSRIRLEQMIGRGTRSQEVCKRLDWLPEGKKNEFLIIDFWENDFNKSPQEELRQSIPVLVSIFNTRLKLLSLYLGDQQTVEAENIKKTLKKQIAEIPRDTFAIKQIWPDISEVWEDEFWFYLTQSDIDFLRLHVGPLLRYVPGVDVQAATFTSKIERLKLHAHEGMSTDRIQQSIAEDASRLPSFVRDDPAAAQAIERCVRGDLDEASAEELNQIIAVLAGKMRQRRQRRDAFLEIDLPDIIAQRGYILLLGGSQKMYVDRYRELVEERVLELAANHPTVEAIEGGEDVSDSQLLDLERTLQEELAGPSVELTEGNIRKAYGWKVGSLIEFMRDLLEVEGIPDYADIVRRGFDDFIASHSEFNANQQRFLRALMSVFLQRRRLSIPELYDPPLSNFGEDAADRWFSEQQRQEMLDFIESLTVTGALRAN